MREVEVVARTNLTSESGRNKVSRAQRSAERRPDRGRAPQVTGANDEKSARDRRLRWVAIGASVSLAILVPLARLVWRWAWEKRARARLDRRILRDAEL